MSKPISSQSASMLRSLLRDATQESASKRRPLSLPDSESIVYEENPGERLELCHRIRECIRGRDDPIGLSNQLLDYVLEQLRDPDSLRGLLGVLEPLPPLPSSPSVRLLAICQFAQAGVKILAESATTILCYAEVLDSLLSSGTAFNSTVYKSLRQQFQRLLTNPENWNDSLHLYSALLVSEGKHAAQDLVALDLFSESLEALLEYFQQCNVERSQSTVYRLLLDSIDHNFDATSCLKAFVLLQPNHSKLKERTLEQTEEFLQLLIRSSRIEPLPFLEACRWFRRLGILDAQGLMANIYFQSMSIAISKGEFSIHNLLGESLEQAIASEVDGHKLQYLLKALERGELQSVRELCDSLQRTSHVKQIENLASQRVLTSKALANMDLLQSPEMAQMVSPELLRLRLNHWQELNAIHRGFTSRLISAKRGPFREPPDLVQFAIDVGGEKSVKYFNAKDPNLFPGKGFFVTRLQLSKCFAPQSNRHGQSSSNSYDLYKKAWPMLAEAIDHFDEAEFVFLRGCILISCKHRDYFLPSGFGEHYSLVVFNDHFRNPFQEVAYLVPNSGVAPLIARTQIPYADFVGFDQRRPDLNSQMQSPASFLEHPLIKEKAIDVGGVSAILSGFEGHLNRIGDRIGIREIRTRLDAIHDRIELHNQATKAWEQRPHRYHLSTHGQSEMSNLSRKGKALEREQALLQQEQSAVLDRVEVAIWNLVDKYTALHKLLCIAHAYWHRGYTAGKMIQTNHISENESFADPFTQSTEEQEDLRLQQSSDAVTNRNAIRMLVQAYEWHSMREIPGIAKDDFPILVVCDATQLGLQPDLDTYLDTYDMIAYIDNQSIPLSHGKMTGDDELFWFTTFFPRAGDSVGVIRDLRFYPRASLGIG